MSPLFGLSRPRSFRLLHTLFRIYTENQPHRHLVAICQLQNYVRDLSRIAFRTPFEASQYLEHRTDRGLVVRQHIRRILTGTPCPVGANTSWLQRADPHSERRDFHRQGVAETAHTRAPYCATRGARSSVRRAPATTLSPAASAASAMSRPNPFPLPVISQTFAIANIFQSRASVRTHSCIRCTDSLLGYARPKH